MVPNRITFISYSKTDSKLITGMVKMLRTQGGKVILDQDFLPGTKWKFEIDEAITVADQIIVFWCCHSSRSEWVKYEMQKSLTLGKPIIPILCCGFEVDESI